MKWYKAETLPLAANWNSKCLVELSLGNEAQDCVLVECIIKAEAKETERLGLVQLSGVFLGKNRGGKWRETDKQGLLLKA